VRVIVYKCSQGSKEDKYVACLENDMDVSVRGAAGSTEERALDALRSMIGKKQAFWNEAATLAEMETRSCISCVNFEKCGGVDGIELEQTIDPGTLYHCWEPAKKQLSIEDVPAAARKGDRVKHSTWGKGTVVGVCIQTENASVHFDRDGDEPINTPVKLKDLTILIGRDMPVITMAEEPVDTAKSAAKENKVMNEGYEKHKAHGEGYAQMHRL
jgi:hypothetical protein